MEYPTKNDFYMRFSALISEEGEFIDFVLVEVSQGFSKATKIKSNKLLGMKLTDISLEINSPILALKELYYHMLPGTRRKFTHSAVNDDRKYVINLFTDDKGYLIVLYTDISKIAECYFKDEEKAIEHFSTKAAY